jgi:hypothetical protein
MVLFEVTNKAQIFVSVPLLGLKLLEETRRQHLKAYLGPEICLIWGKTCL